MNWGIKLFLTLLALCPLCSNALSYYVNENYPGAMLVEGKFEQDELEIFEQHITENDINTIILNSEGGILISSIRMGFYIRENNLNTLVPEDAICFSACTYAFMGGVNRTIGKNAEFAMHRPFFPEEMEGTYNKGYNSGVVTSVMVVTYLIEMGLDPSTASLHLLNKELAHFSAEQQKELHIITAKK